MRISPEGRRSVAMPPSFAISWMPAPAERPSWPPRPGWSSTLWTSVPTGISDSGIPLPTVLADRIKRRRHRLPARDVRAGARLHGHADAQAVRREDVALLAVGVVQQR